MKVFSLTLLALLFVSCASSKKNEDVLEYSLILKIPYETLWRATQQALLNYPMNINNMDTGQLQTLFITGKHRFQPPHETQKVLPSGFQYRLNINILKGEDASKVTIAKEARLQKDFFSEPQDLVSDGFEEKSILYRIKREVLIERLLQRQMEKQQKNPPEEKPPANKDIPFFKNS